MGLSLNVAVTGLQAARAAIQTIGHNISNVNTPGYTRQNVLLKAAIPTPINNILFGNGVLVGNVTRSIDELLNGRIRSQTSTLGFFTTKSNRLIELEAIIDEPSDRGLSKLLNDFFNAVGNLSSAPEDAVLRENLMGNSRTLVEAFNRIASQLFELDQDVSREVGTQVININQLAATVAELNNQIISFEAGTELVASDIRDERDTVLNELANLINIRVTEEENGSVRVQAGGFLLVSNTDANELQSFTDSEGNPKIRLAASTTFIKNPGGVIGSLIDLGSGKVGQFRDSFDQLAENFILEVNRLQTTGVGSSGSFTSLIARNSPSDSTNNGSFADERLDNTGFPFPIQEGVLYINVVDLATNDIEKSQIAVDPTSMTMSDLATAINGISNIGASVDAAGRLRISAQSGYAFDFSPRLDSNPNTAGSFGNGAATISSTNTGPFALSNGDSLTIDVDGGGAQTVTFNSANFANIGAATADEVVAEINSQVTGATAQVVDGRIVISSNSSGTTSSLLITDGAGSPASVLGLSTTAASGDVIDVSVTASGFYTGADNDVFTFRPDNSGEIGVTAGLTVGVFDSNGNRVTTLEVGAGYTIGDELDVRDGVKIAFGAGTIDSTSGDFFDLDVVADSDTSDVLVALGMNTLFTGNDAATLAINPELEQDLSRIAASISGNEGDGENLLRILALQDQEIANLENQSLERFYSFEISSVGFESADARRLRDSQEFVIQNLEIQRLQVSGVSVDEELTNLLQFEQMFNALSRFMSTVSNLENSLLSIV